MKIINNLGFWLAISILFGFLSYPITLSLNQSPQDFWYLERIHLQGAWQVTKGSSDIIVAIIDSGINRTHEDLQGTLWINPSEVDGNAIDDDGNGYIDDINGWDFHDNDNDPLVGTPIHWHGTFVAGLITAQNNAQGVVGVAPNVKIMDLRILDENNILAPENLQLFIDAIEYAVENGAEIINLSLSLVGTPPPAFINAIDNAKSNGTIIVGVTGNQNSNVTFPGSHPDVIAVAATNFQNQKANYSNYGPETELSAPGGDPNEPTEDWISSTYSKPGEPLYAAAYGTSFACPLVTGTIALMLSIYPTLNLTEVLNILHQTAIDLGIPGKDNYFGYGLVNASAAVSMAASMNPDYTSSSSSTSTSEPSLTTPTPAFTVIASAIVPLLLIYSIRLRRKRQALK
ncbi:MAG: S8 family serine peptidase [Candidatus Hermodarchaeota archaeon]